jgi:hypothetical protein
MIADGKLIVIQPIDDLSNICVEVLEEYKVQEGKSFNGVDSIYIATGRGIAGDFTDEGMSFIFITSDNNLYRAAKDEDTFHAFHFWSCNYGCGHVVGIPDRKGKDREEQTKRCPECSNQVVVREGHITRNTCPECGNHCGYCTIEECPSTYTVDFRSISSS